MITRRKAIQLLSALPLFGWLAAKAVAQPPAAASNTIDGIVGPPGSGAPIIFNGEWKETRSASMFVTKRYGRCLLNIGDGKRRATLVAKDVTMIWCTETCSYPPGEMPCGVRATSRQVVTISVGELTDEFAKDGGSKMLLMNSGGGPSSISGTLTPSDEGVDVAYQLVGVALTTFDHVRIDDRSKPFVVPVTGRACLIDVRLDCICSCTMWAVDWAEHGTDWTAFYDGKLGEPHA